MTPEQTKALPAEERELTMEDVRRYSRPETTVELVKIINDTFDIKLREGGKLFPDREDMETSFKSLEAEHLRDYEKKVAGFADQWAASLIRKPDTKKDGTAITFEEAAAFVPIVAILEEARNKHLKNENIPEDMEKVYFSAFAVAVHYERLQKNHIHEAVLFDRYGQMFDGYVIGLDGKPTDTPIHVYYHHLLLLKDMDRELHMTFEEKKILLEQAEKNANNLEGNYGGHHAFAETVAMVFEDLTAEQRAELTNSKKNWLENAKISALLAIDRDKGYAKFYCTYGRVLALLGDLDGAMSNVSRAISFEKSSRKDYSIRIGQYSSYYQQFRAQKKLEEQKAAIDAKVEEVTLQLEASEKESMAKNMEFLGLFSGIVSFTIGSLTITGAIANQSIMKAAGLIVVLLGALMCVFAAFGMILHGFHVIRRDPNTQKYVKRRMWRHLVVFGLGALVVAGGIVLCHFF